MSVHLVKGADAGLRSAAVGDLVHRLIGDVDRSLAVDDFDGDGDAAELTAAVDAASTPPFLTDVRVVVLREVERFGADDVAPLVRYLADPSPTTELVLTQAGGRLSKALADALKQVGALVTDSDPGTGRDRSAWIDERLTEAGVRLDPDARRLLAEQVGEDLGRVPSLLEVLASTYGTERVGADDLRAHLGEAGDVVPWELTDAIDAGRTADAITRARRMMRAGERHPLVIVAVLHGHYQRMLQLDGTDARTEADAAAVLGLKGRTFPARKALEQGQRLGHDGLVRAIGLLAEADGDLKGRRDLPEEVVVEVLVGRLSRLAPTGRARGPAR